ncbi:MAG: X2-like carbohydrate binding domain-containing protein, partial [Bacilli bacterium]|nr:X2-like carbohydrate binding domain-containing protein [Bacilli bacterium]
MKENKFLILLLLLIITCLVGCGDKVIEDPVITVDKAYIEGETDFVITVDLKGNLFQAIIGNNISSSDYTFSNNKLTLKSSYLNQLMPGNYTFIFKTKHKEASFIVKIEKKATVNPELSFPSGQNVFTIGNDSKLTAILKLYDAKIISVYINNEVQSVASYQLNGDKLVIKTEALNELLPKDNNELKIATTSGTVKTYFVINDQPTIKDKTDFIKLPGENIVGEDFTGLAVNTVGDLSYAYSLKSGNGILTDHDNGTFSYTPAVISPGEVIITFTVTDSYGLSVRKDIVLTYKPVNPYIYD